MGRASTKENKNMYQTSREAANLTREGAAELLTYISSDRIEKYRNPSSESAKKKSLSLSERLSNYYSKEEIEELKEKTDDAKAMWDVAEYYFNMKIFEQFDKDLIKNLLREYQDKIASKNFKLYSGYPLKDQDLKKLQIYFNNLIWLYTFFKSFYNIDVLYYKNIRWIENEIRKNESNVPVWLYNQ